MNDVKRLALLLASLDLPEAALRNLIYRLRSLPSEQLLMQVSMLQSMMRHLPLDASGVDVDRDSASQPRYSGDISVGMRVSRLLKEEAGLSTAEAVNSLRRVLVKSQMIRPSDVPPLSKKAFDQWVDRLATIVPAKEILRMATLLRNEYVHSPKQDWSLKKTVE